MDALKLLRTQVAAKIAYLESNQAAADAYSEFLTPVSLAELRGFCNVRADAFREILKDIDALTTPTAG